MCDMIPVARSMMPLLDEYVKEIEPLWESRHLTNAGVLHQRLQNELEKYLGVPHLTLFSNGHMALEAAIQAFGLRGEVITTPFTFASTTQAIVRCGLTPVFCDIDPETLTIDAGKIESLITSQTCAILPVHVYGNICDVEAIDDIAKRYGLRVIYDGAHAFGETLGDVPVGMFGDATMFSFHATKVFHTIEGGGMAYHDPAIGRKAEAIRNFGIYSADLEIEEIGGNAKLSEFHAAMGLCNLRHIEEEIYSRSGLAMAYRERLQNIPGLSLLRYREGVSCNNAYFPVVLEPGVFGETRDALQQRLMENGVISRKYFYPLTSAFDCYRGLFPIQDTPIAKTVSENVLALPIHSSIREADVKRICDIIRDGRL